ncbi:MAG: hypothetical protein LBT05_10830 [Planctomycetaceae bacterium]|jgi:hypothetical protein|nr:hypothetical protein [Planctomycetaceae bacterium]
MKKTQKQKKESQAKLSADLLDTVAKKQMLSLPKAAAFLGIYGRTLCDCFGERAKDIVFVILEKGLPEEIREKQTELGKQLNSPDAILHYLVVSEKANIP